MVSLSSSKISDTILAILPIVSSDRDDFLVNSFKDIP